jgi:hypothetical protein
MFTTVRTGFIAAMAMAFGACAAPPSPVAEASGALAAPPKEEADVDARYFEEPEAEDLGKHYGEVGEATVDVGAPAGADNRGQIQSAIEKCRGKSSCTVRFKKDAIYVINPTASNGNLRTACKDAPGYVAPKFEKWDTAIFINRLNGVTIEGAGATIVNKSPYFDGNWGDMFDVAYSKDVTVKGLKFVNSELKTEAFVKSRDAYNVKLRSNQVESASCAGITAPPVVSYINRNCVGVVASTNVTLNGITCQNTPQTAFAIVGGTARTSVHLTNVHASGGGKHAFRFHGAVSVVMDGKSSSASVRNTEEAAPSNSASKELKGHRVHVWYRDARRDSSVTIRDSVFDESAEVAMTDSGDTFSISNSTMKGGLYVSTSTKPKKFGAVVLRGNTFDCARPVVGSDAALFVNGGNGLSLTLDAKAPSKTLTSAALPDTCISVGDNVLIR